MKGERVFFNGRTMRIEVWLDWYVRTDGQIFWNVIDRRDGPVGDPTLYPPTDEGYAAALADYKRRIAER